MYPRPRCLEELHAIREEMSRECDYDMDLFAEMVRSNQYPAHGPVHHIRGMRHYAPPAPLKAAKGQRKGKKKED
jgi:hypothetical protein